MLEVGDVPALGYHHTLGPRYIACRLSGQRHEVAESDGIGRVGVLAEWHDVILGSRKARLMLAAFKMPVAEQKQG